MGQYFGAGYMGWGSMWMLIFWVVVIALVIWVVRQVSGGGERGSGCCGKHDDRNYKDKDNK
ncbi:MAG: hypothetical protein COV07_03830 [Candidatus Vogelbacteria bacterium CG10_big_fil_rev_8_21_14_0_10_45_14]|uniref:Electron transporter RnfE n=1 Tax=Candidatus Vogelbacteria bacterium CG10_big_fil_rev_8_21_14_0_10_45_14 TaxID=1975042 RepID=A0A2H0RJ09_9BACT|nr:MAG: hypothetical protein COV07_03830 [Candidatus Vogelbacteria bacterium CG10_big_fil_rev_8_21_14_0_10_45_14]